MFWDRDQPLLRLFILFFDRLMALNSKNFRCKSFFLLTLGIIFLINFLIGEALLRVAVFSDLALFAPIRKAQYFTSYGSNDYYKLRNFFAVQHVDKTKRKQLFPQPELGWVGDFSADNYQHNKQDEIKGRQVVLLFGDSFANCMNNPVDYQNILEQDKEFSGSYYLLNYAVDGYGLDQIYLLLTKALSLYNNPIVMFSFTTIDLDRSLVRMTVPQKPYFVVKRDTLYLQKPAQKSIDEFVSIHHPMIRSYFYSFVKSIVFLIYHNAFCPDASVFGDDAERIGPIKRVNKLILMRTIGLLESKNIKYKIFVFHTNWRGESPINNNDWRDSFLLGLFEDLKVHPIWSKSLIQRDALATGTPFHHYFLSDGHPATPYIQLVAREMKHFVTGGGHQ